MINRTGIKYLAIMILAFCIIAVPVSCKKAPKEDVIESEQSEPKTQSQLQDEAMKREDESQRKAQEEIAKQEAKQKAESMSNNPNTANLPGGAATQPPDMTRIATIETNKGVIKFGFFPDKAPNTVENFVKLANDNYFNGIKWHRVVENFVIQGGDPNSKDADPANDGLGGPGYTIDAEFNDLKHLEGTVSMARAQDPNSAGSQFYICLGPQAKLDNQYTIFGQVIEGLDVVHKIQVGDVMSKVTVSGN